METRLSNTSRFGASHGQGGSSVARAKTARKITRSPRKQHLLRIFCGLKDNDAVTDVLG